MSRLLVEEIVDVARKGMNTTDTRLRAQYLSAWKSAVVALALKTKKAADVNAVMKFIHDYAKDVAAGPDGSSD